MFEPKKTKNKKESVIKSLYLHQDLVEKIEEIATVHDTSFNNVVVSMIEKCLDEE